MDGKVLQASGLQVYYYPSQPSIGALQPADPDGSNAAKNIFKTI